MTLRQFLTVTAEVRELDVRAALALALKKELPRSRQSYARFYRRVVEELVASFDLIPNLIETVKGVAKQEEKIYLGVANARKAYFQAGSVGAKARAAGDFERALSRLLVLREAYPQLKSNESFLKFQDQLEGTENRLSVERKRYNDAVTAINTFARKFPGQFYASLAGVERAEYFEIQEAARETPKVKF